MLSVKAFTRIHKAFTRQMVSVCLVRFTSDIVSEKMIKLKQISHRGAKNCVTHKELSGYVISSSAVQCSVCCLMLCAPGNRYQRSITFNASRSITERVKKALVEKIGRDVSLLRNYVPLRYVSLLCLSTMSLYCALLHSVPLVT